MYLYYGQCVPGIVLWTCVFWWYGWIVYCDDDQDGHPYAISLAITDCVISLRWETDGTKTNLLCTRMLVFLALHVFLLSFEWITILSFCLNRSYWLKLKYLLIHHSAEAFYGIVYSFCAVHSPEMFIWKKYHLRWR